jgi:hypothetical protein
MITGLSCGCRVARFCSADHQKMASEKAALGGSLTTGRHKDICGVLSKWRNVVKNGVSPDSCTSSMTEQGETFVPVRSGNRINTVSLRGHRERSEDIGTHVEGCVVYWTQFRTST